MSHVVEIQDVLFRVTPDAFSISERNVRIIIGDTYLPSEETFRTYNRIAAIKALREHFRGLGLCDAAEIVEYVATKLGVENGS